MSGGENLDMKVDILKYDETNNVDPETESKMKKIVEWKDNNDKMSTSISQRLDKIESQVEKNTEMNEELRKILAEKEALQEQKKETLGINMANKIESSMFATLSPEEMKTFKNKANEFVRK